MPKKKRAPTKIKEDLPYPTFKPQEPNYKKQLQDFKKEVRAYLETAPPIPGPEMARFLVWVEPLKKMCSR